MRYRFSIFSTYDVTVIKYFSYIDLRQLREEQNGLTVYRAAIRRGRAKGIAEVSNALFRKAKGGDTRAMIFFLEQLTAYHRKKDS